MKWTSCTFLKTEMPETSRECLECLHSVFQVCTEMSKLSVKWREKIEKYLRPQGSLIYFLVPRAYDKLELPSWLPTKGSFLNYASMSNDTCKQEWIIAVPDTLCAHFYRKPPFFHILTLYFIFTAVMGWFWIILLTSVLLYFFQYWQSRYSSYICAEVKRLNCNQSKLTSSTAKPWHFFFYSVKTMNVW